MSPAVRSHNWLLFGLHIFLRKRDSKTEGKNLKVSRIILARKEAGMMISWWYGQFSYQPFCCFFCRNANVNRGQDPKQFSGYFFEPFLSRFAENRSSRFFHISARNRSCLCNVGTEFFSENDLCQCSVESASFLIRFLHEAVVKKNSS